METIPMSTEEWWQAFIEEDRRQLAFWEKNPVLPFTDIPGINRDDLRIKTVSQLFDVLAHCHIDQVEYEFDLLDRDENIHRMPCYSVTSSLEENPNIHLTTIPGDDGEDIGHAIYAAIARLSLRHAALACIDTNVCLVAGTVTFDVPTRQVKFKP
jgi:hypothetical protein